MGNVIRSALGRIDLQEHQEKILLLLALVISALIGLVVVGFLALTEHLSALLLTAGPAKRFLSPLIGSLAGGWLLYKFFPDARGSGIPQTRVALVLRNGYISLRTVIGKFICSGISLGSGVALGREGPCVQIGGGIASAAGRRLGLSDAQVRSLIPVGTAAAVAAAFNTPLAAVLFTLEEILADLHARVVGSVVIGAATSWIILRLLLGDEPLFHVPAYHLVHPLEFLIYALLGILGGVVSTVFVKALLWQRAFFSRLPEKWKPFTPAVGGLVVGMLALAVPDVLGVGYNLVSQALNGQLTLKMMLLLLALRIVTTSNCYGTGNAGGIFGPSLFIGAMLGGAVGQVAHTFMPYQTSNAGAYALVGMGAAFAGIVGAPMTSVVMIFEVTRDYSIIVPLMIANLCSYVLAQRLQKLPIYEALSRQDGIILPSDAHLPEPLTVAQAMRPETSEAQQSKDLPRVHPDEPLDAALQRMGQAGVDEIAVVTRTTGESPIGILSYQGAFAAYKQQPKFDEQIPRAAVQNWLPAVTVITVGAVVIISGLTFWQRSRRLDLADDAYHTGQTLVRNGQTEEAITEFRGGLALHPQDVRIAQALGLALLKAGHYNDAPPYLLAAVKTDTANGPVWAALAAISTQAGDKQQAIQRLRQAMAADWPAGTESEHSKAQLDYARLLSDAGRKQEAVATLLGAIERRGDSSSTGKRAAGMVKAIGTPEQSEEAYAALTLRFPADAEAWKSLGDVRLEEGKLPGALEAYQRAQQPDAVERVEQILRLDPSLPRLSFRERAGRWQEILRKLVDQSEGCAAQGPLKKAAALLKRPPANVTQLDDEIETAKEIWRSGESVCLKDDALAYVFARLPESAN